MATRSSRVPVHDRRRSAEGPVCSMLAVAALLVAGCTAAPRPDPALIARESLIVDTHIDVPYRVYRQPQDVSVATATGEFDYPRAAAGGLDVVFMSIYVPVSEDEAGRAWGFADNLISSVRSLAASAPDRFAMITCTSDVEAVKSSDRIGFAMGMENGAPLQGDLANLDYFKARGIRYITLAHARSNHIADSSYDPNERWQGLSPFGRRLVAAMNQRGVMVDVSHISDRAFWQVLERSAVPVIASHSSLRYFTPEFQRNLSDDMVRAIAAGGGVVQINFGSGFLTAAATRWGSERAQAVTAFRDARHLAADDPAVVDFEAAYRTGHPYPYASVDDVVDHIDRVVAIAGIDAVGLGSDYDGVGDTLPEGLKDVSAYPNLVAALVDRGYDRSQIDKILGGNLMRVWRQVEAYGRDRGYPPSCSQ